MIFSWLKRRKASKTAAHSLYLTAVRQARSPAFYSDYGVADTFDGRFDMLCLHVALIMNRLEEVSGAQRLRQALFDRMFRDMDYTLREMGVGDLAVPKHMKKMMKAYNGRFQVYRAALKTGDGDALEQALLRNAYREGQGHAGALCYYAGQSHALLLGQDSAEILSGTILFPNPTIMPEEQLKHG